MAKDVPDVVWGFHARCSGASTWHSQGHFEDIRYLYFYSYAHVLLYRDIKLLTITQRILLHLYYQSICIQYVKCQEKHVSEYFLTPSEQIFSHSMARTSCISITISE